MILDFDYISELEIRNPYMELTDGSTISNPLILTTVTIEPKYGKLAIKDLDNNWINSSYLPERSIVRFFIKGKKVFLIQQKAITNSLYISFKMTNRRPSYSEAVNINDCIWIYENLIENDTDFQHVIGLDITQSTARDIENYVMYNLKTHLPEYKLDEIKPEIKRIMNIRNKFINKASTDNEKMVAIKIYKQRILNLRLLWKDKL